MPAATATVLSTTKLTIHSVGLLASAITTSNPEKIRGDHPIVFRANREGHHTPESLRAAGYLDLSRVIGVILDCGHSNNESLIELAVEWTMAGFSVTIAFPRFRFQPEPQNYDLPYTFGLDASEAYEESLGGWQATVALERAVHHGFADMPLVVVV